MRGCEGLETSITVPTHPHFTHTITSTPPTSKEAQFPPSLSLSSVGIWDKGVINKREWERDSFKVPLCSQGFTFIAATIEQKKRFSSPKKKSRWSRVMVVLKIMVTFSPFFAFSRSKCAAFSPDPIFARTPVLFWLQIGPTPTSWNVLPDYPQCSVLSWMQVGR